ncbi:hypothetical protein BDZ91DRAFT_734394, partial [Kalaharituber pfeilii]
MFTFILPGSRSQVFPLLMHTPLSIPKNSHQTPSKNPKKRTTHQSQPINQSL